MTEPERNPEAITVDELAARTGMTVRNLREWRTLGLLPAAELRGRVGYYDPALVERVQQIQKLHAEGFTLELIRKMLDAGGEDVMRLAGALRAPFRTAEASVRIAQIGDELRALGLSDEQLLEATATIREHADGIAELFERVWYEHIWDPFVEAGMPEERLAELGGQLSHVQPLALDAVVAIFTVAMEARIEKGIARELGRD